ncbi:MAG: hypothetical protein M0R17_02980 [Candidatus Omnitrophica bacterium]|jgi:hypothetical protein|nr:hypothetical protein [Candidatus Omnitrophota bacterium]
MKVKIIDSPSEDYWYYPYINQTIEVEDKDYNFVDGLNYKAIIPERSRCGYILASDCEIYTEPIKKRTPKRTPIKYKTINLRRDYES